MFGLNYKYILISLILYLPLPGKEFQGRFEHLTLEDGLSQNSVFCMIQDLHGFLWFGTEDGLNRYDGYSFTVFRHQSSDSLSLSDNFITALYEDDTGLIWIGTENGLNRFDPITETFKNWQKIEKLPPGHGLSDNKITEIFEDRFGKIWIGTYRGGLNCYDRQSDKFRHWQHDPENSHSLSLNYITAIYEDEQGNLWIGTYNGLNLMNRETGQFRKWFPETDNPNSLSHQTIWSIGEIKGESKSTLWIGSQQGMNRFNPTDSTFTPFLPYPENPEDWRNSISSFSQQNHQTTWISTYGGLYITKFEKDEPHFKQFLFHRENDPTSLSSNWVTAIRQDRSGVWWVATENGGLNKYSNLNNRFGFLTNRDTSDQPALSHKNVMPIFETNNGDLWIGTERGLNRWDRKNGKIQQWFHQPDNPYSLSANNITTIVPASPNSLWIGTSGGGLNLLDIRSGTFRRWLRDPGNPQGISHNYIMCMNVDQTGLLWIGMWGAGLNRLDPKTGLFAHWRNNPNDPTSLSHDDVWCILEDRYQFLWVGTKGGGLNRYEREIGQFVHYTYNSEDSTSISSDVVFSILESQDGFLWIGTKNGLNKFDRKTGTFLRYAESDGLPNNVVYGILEDDQGFLWLSTNKGISRFNPISETFDNYDILDGLPSNEFSSGSYFKNKQGELFFGGINGFIFFHPDSIHKNLYIPPIHLTGFQILNQPIVVDSGGILSQSLIFQPEITLSYHQNVFSFEFAALDYSTPEKNQYAYMMEGFDQGWIQAGNRRFASYTNLPPDSYTFQVKGTNSDGLWNENGAAIQIIITPPWWRTNWAYGLYIIMFGFALFIIRKYELRRVRLKDELKLKKFEAEKLQEVDHMKSRFFANISHEFRTPLTLVIGPLEQFMKKIPNEGDRSKIKSVIKQAHRVLNLINEILDLSKLEAGKLNLQVKAVDVNQFLVPIVHSFASWAEQKNITLDFSPLSDTLNIYLDTEKVEKVLNNLLSNALKFTPEGGLIIVDLGVQNVESDIKNNSEFRIPNSKFLTISVSDTGPGIPPEQLPYIFERFYQTENARTRAIEGSGIGLALTKELVDLHYGHISVESELGKGTTFTLYLLLGRKHLRDEEIISPDVVIEDRLTPLSTANWKLPTWQEENGDRKPVTETNKKLKRTEKKVPVILIVEDHVEVRDYIKEQLVDDYYILDAEDGKEGLNQATENQPDLIISDVMMPVMDGFELCQNIKTNIKTSHIPVILLTARASDESKISGLETGADDYLIKPFNARELQLRVRNLLASRQKLQENFQKELIMKPAEVTVTSLDETLLKKVVQAVEENMDNLDFNVKQLCQAAAMSHSNLHRKVQALTGQSPSVFIRTIRLKRAAQLLKLKKGNVTEIAFDVGFSSPAYFTKCFKEQFGHPPSEFPSE